MTVIPAEEISWKTVAANARVGGMQNNDIREGEVLPDVQWSGGHLVRKTDVSEHLGALRRVREARLGGQ